jgi:hypothetical protein
MSNVRPFGSRQEKIAFARELLRGRARSFRKDVDICLSRNETLSHAYFPALSTCISFLDFLSGLYAGTMHGHGFKEFMIYTTTFLDPSKYGEEELEILYEGFRHKIAHLGHPYAVFDTDTSPRLVNKRKRRLVTWTVYAARRKNPLELKVYQAQQTVRKALAPWPVSYDCRLCISTRTLAEDIRRTIRGKHGFLYRLATEPALLSKFSNCLTSIYPR